MRWSLCLFIRHMNLDNVLLKNTFLFIYAQIMMISCPWFVLIDGYKSAYERLLSQVMIWSPHWYKLLWVWNSIIWSLKLDYPMPVIWYCWWLQIGLRETVVSSYDSVSHRSKLLCVNISQCFLLSYMFKLDDVMLMIWSCWWVQISVQETLLSSHNLVSTLIQIIVCMRFSSSIVYLIIMHIVYVKYDIQIIICITPTLC
jgi:hypothetical protein